MTADNVTVDPVANALKALRCLYLEVPASIAQDVEWRVKRAFAALAAAPSVPSPVDQGSSLRDTQPGAADGVVADLLDAAHFAKAAQSALNAYEADLGARLDDMHELGRIDDSAGSPSFRIRVGHIRGLSAALAKATALQADADPAARASETGR